MVMSIVSLTKKMKMASGMATFGISEHASAVRVSQGPRKDWCGIFCTDTMTRKTNNTKKHIQRWSRHDPKSYDSDWFMECK